MLSLSGGIGLEDAAGEDLGKSKKGKPLMPPLAVNMVGWSGAAAEWSVQAARGMICAAQVAVVVGCASWMSVSSALILVNKHCMSVDGFAYPMALSGLGMAFSSVAATLCCKVRDKLLEVQQRAVVACRFQRACALQVFRLVEIKHHVTWQYYLTRIMPIGLFMALTLYFGNIVYLYLTVSFIQMLKVLLASPLTWSTTLPQYAPHICHTHAQDHCQPAEC